MDLMIYECMTIYKFMMYINNIIMAISWIVNGSNWCSSVKYIENRLISVLSIRWVCINSWSFWCQKFGNFAIQSFVNSMRKIGCEDVKKLRLTSMWCPQHLKDDV